MSENLDPKNRPQPEIIRNDLQPNDSTVVVDEADRTVLLTDEETIIIEKQPKIGIAPKNRPRKVNLGMFGPTEYVIVGLGLLSLLATFLFFMFVVTPARAQLSRHQDERKQLEKELDTNREKYQGFTTTEEQVTKLVSSVDNFEMQYLPVSSYGRTALYQNLNTLIARYGLVNTSGPDYAPLEINQRQGQTEAERGRAKYQSLFPGVYVTMTVEGSYQNLRRFLRDIETDRQFMVVSTVELEPSENEGQQSSDGATNAPQNNPQQPTISNLNQRYARPNAVDPTGAANGPTMMPNAGQMPTQSQPTERPRGTRGRTIGENVSLKIELAAYFKRNAANAPGQY